MFQKQIQEFPNDQNMHVRIDNDHDIDFDHYLGITSLCGTFYESSLHLRIDLNHFIHVFQEQIK